MKNRKRQGATVGVVAGLVAAFAVAWMASVGAAVSPASAPASASQYEKKVTICHRTGSKKNPFRTIRVSRNAVKAHLRHGDALGPCSSAVFAMCHKTKHGKKMTVKVKGSRKVQRAMKRGDGSGSARPRSTSPSTASRRARRRTRGSARAKARGTRLKEPRHGGALSFRGRGPRSLPGSSRRGGRRRRSSPRPRSRSSGRGGGVARRRGSFPP